MSDTTTQLAARQRQFNLPAGDCDNNSDSQFKSSVAAAGSPFWLGVSGLISWLLYVALVWLSRGFTYETPGPERPLLSALMVILAACALYLLQVAMVIRGRAGAKALPVIIVFAVAFRVLLLFSEPIQEVDAYRYVWDGKVTAAGVNPFRYSPDQVRAAASFDNHPEDLKRLVELRDQSPANATILARVHFGELTSVYPVVSQVVFALAALVTPDPESVQTQLLAIKSVIVLFDLATIWVLILLLRFAGRPAEWSIVYAWCPLVLKEFANSGHLDSIAVFFTVAAVLCAVRGLFPHENESSPNEFPPSRVAPRLWLFATAIILSLGIGAKIYPIVLTPLLFLSAWRRIGRVEAVSAGIIVLFISAATVAPMLFRDRTEPAPERVGAELNPDELPPVMGTAPTQLHESPPKRIGPRIDPNATGLGAFATQWQMNDFLFLILFENVKPGVVLRADDDLSSQSPPMPADPELPPYETAAEVAPPEPTDKAHQANAVPWFVVTSRRSRVHFVNVVAKVTSLSPKQIPFYTARLLTSAVFLFLAVWWACRGMRSKNPNDWLHAAFLTLAWFWLLQPTQNPWYWIWALPLVPFARSRAWLAMSGLTLLYYTRFWFAYHADSTPLFGTPYAGVDFFDYIVTWIEYGPWFLWLMLAMLQRKRKLLEPAL